MIKKIKETLSQMFFSPEATGTWSAPEVETQTSLLQKKAGTYTGIPAPRVLEDDEWFGPAPVSDANLDYMEQETLIKQEEYQETHHSVEPENIHQVMYEMATQNSATTLQLDPIGGSENFQGGSENIHKG
tara:strand:- start:1432 stop:1821 length:390 start_codon:yes stop_codon:yes gene_type:complete